MSVSIDKFGNLVKINTGNGVIQYFDSNIIAKIIQIEPTTLYVRGFNGSNSFFETPLSQVTINGVAPLNVSEFESALNELTEDLIFDKLDPFLALGFATAPIGANVRRVTALGNNPDVDQGTVPEDIWPGGGLYPWLSAATSLEAVSTSAQDASGGTGMAAISLTLLDANYAESSVPVALNGLTAVPISGTWLRINTAVTTTKGSGAPATRAVNVGDIIIRDAGGGTTRAIIPAGKGILRQAVFTVPAGYSMQIISQYIGFNRGTGGGATRYLTVSGFIQSAAGVVRLPLDLSCNGESYRHDGLPGITIPEKTDFALEVISVSADNSDVTGAFLAVLMKNNVASTINF